LIPSSFRISFTLSLLQLYFTSIFIYFFTLQYFCKYWFPYCYSVINYFRWFSLDIVNRPGSPKLTAGGCWGFSVLARRECSGVSTDSSCVELRRSSFPSFIRSP
jgi:hypothetical protein